MAIFYFLGEGVPIGWLWGVIGACWLSSFCLVSVRCVRN